MKRHKNLDELNFKAKVSRQIRTKQLPVVSICPYYLVPTLDPESWKQSLCIFHESAGWRGPLLVCTMNGWSWLWHLQSCVWRELAGAWLAWLGSCSLSRETWQCPKTCSGISHSDCRGAREGTDTCKCLFKSLWQICCSPSGPVQRQYGKVPLKGLDGGTWQAGVINTIHMPASTCPLIAIRMPSHLQGRSTPVLDTQSPPVISCLKSRVLSSRCILDRNLQN